MQQKTSRRATHSMMLSVVAILFCLLLWGVQGVWVLYGSASNVMSQVGLQRSRVERLTKDALIIVGPMGQPSNFTDAVSEIQNTLPGWQQSQKGLQIGDASLGLPPRPPANIVLPLIQSQADFSAITTALQNIVVKPTRQSTLMNIQLQIILDHEPAYYQALSQVNTFWKQRIDDTFFRLFWIETSFVVGIALCTIFQAIFRGK